jgi:ribosome biogenesis protein Nip4
MGFPVSTTTIFKTTTQISKKKIYIKAYPNKRGKDTFLFHDITKNKTKEKLTKFVTNSRCTIYRPCA